MAMNADNEPKEKAAKEHRSKRVDLFVDLVGDGDLQEAPMVAAEELTSGDKDVVSKSINKVVEIAMTEDASDPMKKDQILSAVEAASNLQLTDEALEEVLEELVKKGADEKAEAFKKELMKVWEQSHVAPRTDEQEELASLSRSERNEMLETAISDARGKLSKKERSSELLGKSEAASFQNNKRNKSEQYTKFDEHGQPKAKNVTHIKADEEMIS